MVEPPRPELSRPELRVDGSNSFRSPLRKGNKGLRLERLDSWWRLNPTPFLLAGSNENRAGYQRRVGRGRRKRNSRGAENTGLEGHTRWVRESRPPFESGFCGTEKGGRGGDIDVCLLG